MQLSGLARNARVQVPLDQIPFPHNYVTVDSVETLELLPDVVVEDAKWFRNFSDAFNGRVDFTDAELEVFLIGYQKYLYLLTKVK